MKSLFIFILLLIIPFSVSAASLVWDSSTGTVNGYRVYFNDMNNFSEELGPDINAWTLPTDMIVGQEYLIGVSAFNQAGESSKAKIRFTWEEDIEIILPKKPVNINIRFD